MKFFYHNEGFKQSFITFYCIMYWNCCINEFYVLREYALKNVTISFEMLASLGSFSKFFTNLWVTWLTPWLNLRKMLWIYIKSPLKINFPILYSNKMLKYLIYYSTIFRKVLHWSLDGFRLIGGWIQPPRKLHSTQMKKDLPNSFLFFL